MKKVMLIILVAIVVGIIAQTVVAEWRVVSDENLDKNQWLLTSLPEPVSLLFFGAGLIAFANLQRKLRK